MVEEIRSYLLNSREYSKYVYMPDGYSERKMGEVESQFRYAVLGIPNISDKKVHVWRANALISGLYRDRQLSAIAQKLFDPRTIETRSTNNGSMQDDYYVSSKDPSLLIVPDHSDLSPSFSIEKSLMLTRESSTELNACITEGPKTTNHIIQFTFSDGVSDFVKVPDLPIKIAFNLSDIGGTNIPSNFVTTLMSFTYSHWMDVDELVNVVNQISGLDTLIWSNKVANEEILPLYSTTTMSHKRLLCVLLAYALSIKQS